MNNFHYNQDPMYAAAAAILAGQTLDEQIDQLDEYESPHKTKAQKLQNVRDRIKETQERIAKIRKDQSTGEGSRGPRGDWLRIIDMHNADLKKLIAREKKIMKMTEEEELEEGLEAITSAVEGLKKGDKTNFGVVTDIGSNSISFKAKDLPVTKIPFNQRKMGSSDYVLDKLVKLKESIELEEESGNDKIISFHSAAAKKAYITKNNLASDEYKDYGQAGIRVSAEFVKNENPAGAKQLVYRVSDIIGQKNEELDESVESVELDEAKAANPADLRNIIRNHTQLLTKATTPSAKEFHKVAIANAKEKLKALGEDADSITEVLDPDAEASVWIDDFVKSDDPKFDGKSKDERIKMALGAWYAAQKKESIEVTDDSIEEAFRPGADMVPAPIGKDTVTAPGLKKLWGVQMRAGKWADTFVGLWDDSSDKPFGIIDADGVTRYSDITKFMSAFSKLTK